MNDQHNWYENFFDGIANDFWEKAVTPAQTEAEVSFIKSQLGLKPGASILDIPCGFGRHTLTLAREGYAMTGIDISQPYIDKLKRNAAAADLPVEAICADMTTLDMKEQFEAAICMGNSLFYFDHAKMVDFLRRVYRSLKPGGGFAAYAAVTAEGLLPILKQRNWMQFDDILYLNHNTYLAQDSMLKTDYRFIRNGVEEAKTAYYYVMTVAEIKRVFALAGFTRISLFGGMHGEPFKWGDPEGWMAAWRE